MNSQVPTLPPNTTALERAIAIVCAQIADIPVPIRELWDPDRCPVALLPVLARDRAVDQWDESWPEPVKRRAIKAAYYIHKHKGTIAAVRRVIESLGYVSDIVEWWQTEPEGPAGTFSLEVGMLDKGITDEIHVELERLIADAKPLSRHMIALELSLEVGLQVFAALAVTDGDEMDVYPWPDTAGKLNQETEFSNGQ